MRVMRVQCANKLPTLYNSTTAWRYSYQQGTRAKGVSIVRYIIRERFFRLGEDSDITDEEGRPVLHVDGKVLTLHDTLIVRDPAGTEVARVQRQLIALRPTYHITRQGEELAAVRKQLISPFVDRFTIDVPGP